MKILAVGFLGVILIGAVLLWLPICNEKPISFLDALFTSTTSVCVTGLITIVPKYQFTIVGKVVLLLLIQIGGLGIVACVAAFFMIMRRKITLKERIVIQETYNMDSLADWWGWSGGYFLEHWLSRAQEQYCMQFSLCRTLDC